MRIDQPRNPGGTWPCIRPNCFIILFIPPLPNFFIIFCIWVNCLSILFTSWMVVPDPTAMRRFRDPLITSGNWRSWGVMELMIAIMWLARHMHAGVPEDEIAGLEANLDHWKF